LKEELQIDKEGIETGLATFKIIVPSEQVRDERQHATLRFVAEEDNRVEGWIGISPVSTRSSSMQHEKINRGMTFIELGFP